ncbi:unnamed protein product [Rotaria magnacalcarata]|uniref:RIOX1/NO66-like C-terminal winged helix domain-containing protein n=1 Tax=Rotaria magnacalcarata TaxID=392030 RepID=A0A820DFI4_9BILA|nr:unnamed protein product [Rotaria magnacalcarata]CAF2096271.1 unnamed protein product [Rotaria magnacalcarata]CAF2116844.1 unnamed protein product [Rotaria magnacalcarata]CAF3864985.1 unnamed protein product [Rotaria magnacalcarata]CAF4077610.1 unnamed protein product [Rotaria magnacalcarata]
MENNIDTMAQQFMHDALSPINIAELQSDTRIRLLRRYCLRVVEQDDNGEGDSEQNIVAYYTADNARRYHDRSLSTLGVDKETLPALEMLFVAYPEYINSVRTEYEFEHSDAEDESDDSDDDDEQEEDDALH